MINFVEVISGSVLQLTSGLQKIRQNTTISVDSYNLTIFFSINKGDFIIAGEDENCKSIQGLSEQDKLKCEQCWQHQ